MTNTANIGEWSELYALGIILSQGGLYASDADEKIRRGLFYRVIEAYIKDNLDSRSRKYLVTSNNIRIYDGCEELLTEISQDKVARLAKTLFTQLAISQDGRAFALIQGDELASNLRVAKLKASSSEKSDLSLVILDGLTKSPTPKTGFSIKSQIGAPATLINASASTNFIFKIQGKGEPDNLKPKQVKKNTQAIYSQGFTLEFIEVESATYAKNMRLIDSRLPNYLAELLVGFYRRKGGSIDDVIQEVFTEDIVQKTHKVKEFLVASALGMMPSTEWDGHINDMGGFILVKKTGDVLCFYLYNMVDFQNYLIKNTKFDTPSTSRYSIGKVIKTEQGMYYKLNLQIRFKV